MVLRGLTATAACPSTGRPPQQDPALSKEADATLKDAQGAEIGGDH